MGLFYVSYGRNMCEEIMRQRCRRAAKIGKWGIARAKLIFRDVADITDAESGRDFVPAGLWWISDECEGRLDSFEGQGYCKLYWPERTIDGRTGQIMTYQMITGRGVRPPEQEYYDAIVQGYKDFGHGEKARKILDAAVEWAKENKHVTQALHERFVRRGRKPRVKLEVRHLHG
jgi:hypothetical protein